MARALKNFGILLFLFLGQRYVHALACVDEYDRAGGDCRTSECIISCSTSFDIGTTQSKRQDIEKPPANWITELRSRQTAGKAYSSLLTLVDTPRSAANSTGLSWSYTEVTEFINDDSLVELTLFYERRRIA